MITLRAAQIGRCGELLVQFKLLMHGIESSSMTTDNGIDLVAYAPKSARAVTIQVKTNLQPKPAGGKGPLALDWWLPENSPAELVALVNLQSEQVWLLRHDEVISVAEQFSSGHAHFYFYSDPAYQPKKASNHIGSYAHFLINERIADLF